MEKKKKLSILEAENEIGFDETSIGFWHNSLKLSSTNNVLVAFAWAHDDELRNVEMFPEILAIDVTFGVNKERRDLLIATTSQMHFICLSTCCITSSHR
jgi:hypothetical protein